MRPTPARERARRFLLALAERARDSAGGRLPTIAALAHSAGVAKSAMSHAVRELRSEGVVSSVQGAGTHLVSPALASALATQRQPDTTGAARGSSARTATAVRQALRLLVYPPGSRLPSTKVLCDTYGVCPRTMQRVLRALVSDGDVEPQRRGYRVVSYKASGPADTIVLIARAGAGGSVLSATSRTIEQLRTLEQECARVGARLRVETCDVDGGGISLNQDGLRQTVLGYVVWTTALSAAGLRTVLGLLAGTVLPVSILDETAAAARIGLARRGPYVRVFAMSSTSLPGDIAGRYLRDLGHRRIVYLSHAPGEIWSVNRLAGLCTALRQPDAHGTVVLLQTDLGPAPAPVKRAVDRALAQFERVGVADQTMRREFLERLSESAKRAHYRKGIEPLLQQARALRDVTAWVAANDTIALIALDALRTWGIDVPRELSLIGFDDSTDACLGGLTSYNFNHTAVAHAMVAHLVHPSRSAARAQSDELAGFVSRRATCGAPGLNALGVTSPVQKRLPRPS